ncbi:hypothetical protein [Mucilaginibacter gotjawali]|uniref:Uncharacterized protein n=2 Tax=Mucilaginibacter gotjawali TaxID=1550579 RepID=A0A839SKD2_9SPHI|nr:hypothetical protein [Mucilaginibacter gotjawali]MBB3057714.1 hypothetical protein [Mucilaginibacter gotjawali]BAU52517.1 hypothetical protein MgSA37_00678 [Mucilaginibacter gotjawali]
MFIIIRPSDFIGYLSNFDLFPENMTNEIPQWQQELVLDRIEQARLHPETMLDWDEVSKTLMASQSKTKSDIKKLRTRQIQRHNKNSKTNT